MQRDVLERVSELADRDRARTSAESRCAGRVPKRPLGRVEPRGSSSSGVAVAGSVTRVFYRRETSGLRLARHGSDDRGPPDRRRPHPGRRLARRGRGRSRGARRFGAREALPLPRAVVEDALRRDESRLYGVTTGFGRFVSTRIPDGAGRGAPAPAPAEPRLWSRRAVPGRDRARGDAAAREHARQGLLRRARRDGRAAARVPEPRRRSRTCRAAARSARAATSRRSRTSRCRSSARARRWFDGERARRAARRSQRRASSRSGSQAKEGLSLVNGTQFMAAFGALGLVRARRLAKAADIACALSLEALQGSRDELPAADPRAAAAARPGGLGAANVLRLLEGSAINEAHRWCDQVQDAYSLRCAPQVHGAAPRPARLRRATPSSVELNAATDNPLVLRRGRAARLERQLPRPAGRVRARRAGDGGRRAREHLRAARSSGSSTRASPTACRRS